MQNGGSIGYYIEGRLPNITASTYGTAAGYLDYMISWMNSTGAFYGISTTSSHGIGGGGSHGSMMALGFDASRSSSIYMSDEGGVVPRSITTNFIIKY